MKETLLRQAAKIKKKNHQHKHWQKAVSILACIVVFCTVYALILPAVTMEKTAYCGKEEHTHTEECYEEKLSCGKEEGDGAHQHTDDCYQEKEVLVCQEPETDGHQHTDDCYTEEEVLTCTNTDPDHEHNEFDGCYTKERELTCGKQLGEGAHHHDASCYETQKVLVCGLEENDGHHHSAECYKKELTCGKEEHTHTLACYSDPDADVESEAQWSRSFANVTLTDDWAKDAAAIADTQTGYTESDRNYTVNDDNTINGYTRYGQWAGMPYADWSATFTSFCLYYANVPESAVPRNTGCEGWNSSAVSPNGYTPKEGDIILLDGNQDGTTDHAGIVTSGSGTSVTAIVGDADKAVRRNSYSTSDSVITGYVPMPENPALSGDDTDKDTTPTPEVTEEPEETPTPEITEEPEATPTPEVTEEPQETPTPEVTEEPEETPTPEVTETPEATPTPEIKLEHQTAAAELYTDSTYTVEEQSESAVIISGDLPENGSIKAYPVNNISMEGKKVLCAWDITIFDADGNKWEPMDGNVLSVKFQIPDLTTDENEASEIYYIPDENSDQPEKLESQVTDDGISFEAEHFSIYTWMVAQNNEDAKNNVPVGVDFTTYIENVSIQYKPGGNGLYQDVPQDADGNYQLSEKDSLRFKINYKLPGHTLSQDNKKVYYQLPAGIKINSDESGKVYNSAGQEVGEYSIDKTGMIMINFFDSYVNGNSNGSEINGYINFESSVKDIETADSGKTTISFKDDVSISLKVTDKTVTRNDLKVEKETLEVDNETGIIKYKIKVSSTEGTGTVVNLSDVMSEVIYMEGSLVIKDKNENKITNIAPDKTEEGFNIKLPKMNAGDFYTIEYSAKLASIINGEVTAKNKVTVNSKGEDDANLYDESSVENKIIKKVISKKGETQNDGRIIWTISINESKSDIGGWTLEDKLNGSEYRGTVNISPAIEVNGVMSDEITLPFTFPEGTNSAYTITYITDAEKEIGSTQMKNKAYLKKDKTFDTGDIGVEIDGEKFNPVSKEGKGVEENPDGETVSIKWKVTFNATDKIKGPWTLGDSVNNNSQYFTVAQLKSLKQKLDSEFEKIGLQYESFKVRNSSDWNWENIQDILDTNNEKPFYEYKITFEHDVEKGKNFAFEYESTAKLQNGTQNYYNGITINDKWLAGASNSYTSVKPTIEKVDAANISGGNNTNHKIEDVTNNGQSTLRWNVKVSIPQGYNGGDLTVKEKLPKGVSLTAIKISTSNNNVKDSDITEAGEHTISSEPSYSVRTSRIAATDENGEIITMLIPADMANGLVGQFITFDIQVTINADSGWTSGNKEFGNSVSLINANGKEIGKADQTQTIQKKSEEKRVKKSVKQIDGTNILEYSIVINPEGKDLLVGADTLTLTDILTKVNYIPNGLFIPSLVPESVHIYERNPDGSKKEPALSTEKYPYIYNESHTVHNDDDRWMDCRNELIITIPDSMPLIVEYRYIVNSNKSDAWPDGFNNSAELNGEISNAHDEITNTKIHTQNSSAGADINGVNVFKVDSNNTSKGLAGAKFTVYYWDADQSDYVQVKEEDGSEKIYTSDDTGLFQIKDVKVNTAYKLVEIEAPNGYIKNEEPYYFFVRDTGGAQISKPDGFEGTEYVAGGTIYRPNTKSSSYTLPETGGTGTNRFTAVGLSLMAVSLMCEYVMRRKRRERRGN